jgi:hypothetical protein
MATNESEGGSPVRRPRAPAARISTVLLGLVFLALADAVQTGVLAGEATGPQQANSQLSGGSDERRAQPFVQGLAGQTLTGSVTLSRDIVASRKVGIVIAQDDVVLDCGGHTISGPGSGRGVECVDCNRVTIRNCTIENFEQGIYFAGSDRLDATLSTHNSIVHNELAGNARGIDLIWSHHTTIADNVIVGSSDAAISLAGAENTDGPCSDHTTITGNTLTQNRRGLLSACSYKPQQGNVVEDNSFQRNTVSVTGRFEPKDRIRYRSNTFGENLTTLFLQFEGNHLLEPRASKSVEIHVRDSDGEPCSDFEIRRVETSPPERVTSSKSDNRILASFKPRRKGLYSLGVTIEGCGQESIHQRFWFGKEKSTTLYLASGDRRDAGTLINTPPEESVYVWCTMWIEAGPVEFPSDTGIVKVTKFSSSMWSNYTAFPSSSVYSNLCSIEFDHTYSRRGDLFVSVDGKHENGLAQVTAEFQGGPFLHGPEDWRDLSVKYWGRSPDWISEPGKPSSVVIHYLVTENPTLELVSGSGVQILSATSTVGSNSRSEIVLQGRGETGLRMQMGDASRAYRVEVDGVPCRPGGACVAFQEAGLIRLNVDLADGQAHTISIAGTRPKPER